MIARSEGRAAFMLTVVTALWGMSFTWTKGWQVASQGAPGGELLSSLTLIAVRMPLALLVMGAWKPRVFSEPTRQEHAGGMALGAVFFAGFALQTWGLADTTPALSGFFTSLCSAWAPLIGLVVLRERIAPLTLLGLALALVGCAALVDGWNLGKGEWLTVIASVFFAMQLLVLDRLGKNLEPAHLTAGFLATTGALALACAILVAVRECGIGAWLAWLATMLSRAETLTLVACQAVFASAIAFHWMNTYQPLMSPSKAALIYLLEPVWTLMFSVLGGYDQLTYPLVVGGVLILAGNLVPILPHLARTRPPVPVESKTDGG